MYQICLSFFISYFSVGDCSATVWTIVVWAIDQHGKISENGGTYSTLSIDNARRKIIEDLESGGHIVKQESILHRIPISRRRFYGTEIPIWYCNKCKEPMLPAPGKYYRPWKDKAPFDKCVKCGHNEFTGDDRTFDTWMDSSISPLFVTKYGKDREFFAKT